MQQANYFAARRLNIHCHGHAPPRSKKPRKRYTARLMRRLPILRGSAVVSSIGEAGNGCIETEQY
jgi:hypothetical protein